MEINQNPNPGIKHPYYKGRNQKITIGDLGIYESGDSVGAKSGLEISDRERQSSFRKLRALGILKIYDFAKRNTNCF